VPEAFHNELKAGVEDGSIKFTNRGDVDLVASIYERAFLDEMTAATVLYYVGFGWGDAEMVTLSSAISYAHTKGALPQLEKLSLNNNQIGDAGVDALAKACAGGALAQLEVLWLGNNQIGDAGVKALSQVCARGALASLTHLYLNGNLIGDAGVKSLAKACGGGALPRLRTLVLFGNPASEAAQQAAMDAIKNRK